MSEPVKLPSQYANNDGSFNWVGATFIAVSVAVMILQIVQIVEERKEKKLEKIQQAEINQMKADIDALKQRV